MAGEPVDGQLQQTRIVGLHAVDHALLDPQVVAGDQVGQRSGLIAAGMSHVIVENGPPRGMKWDGEYEPASRRQYAGEFGEDTSVVLDVFDHITGDDEIEAGVGVGEFGDVSRTCYATFGLQAGEGGNTGIEEVSAGDWQAWSQPGADLEAPRRHRQQAGDERPSVEAFRPGKVSPGPECIV